MINLQIMKFKWNQLINTWIEITEQWYQEK